MSNTLQVESYVARRRFKVGDRWVDPGDPVPEAETWRRPDSWVRSGHLALTFRDVDETAAADLVADAVSGDITDIAGTDAALGDLSVKDLVDIAKSQGRTGYSRMKKDDLVALIESPLPEATEGQSDVA